MAVAELQPGDRLGPGGDGSFRYEVVSTLGAGGFGITYLARDLRLDGEVVLKELACASMAYRDSATGRVQAVAGQDAVHRKLVARFVREAQLLNRLRSRHIVRVTDVWEERGTAYYAMDKVDALRHLDAPGVSGLTTRSWTEARVYAVQLLDALDAVHTAGLVHGDVKPANVLIDRKRGVVLIDFGTARADDEFGRTITSTSFTRGYAPPELMHPSRVREAGPWSDIYSWGMVVWGLVTDHPGDDGRPVDAVARDHGLDPYVDAHGQLATAGLPDEWATCVAACIALEPSGRPVSVDAIRARLGLLPREADRSIETARTVEARSTSRGSDAPSTQTLDGPDAGANGRGPQAAATIGGASSPDAASGGDSSSGATGPGAPPPLAAAVSAPSATVPPTAIPPAAAAPSSVATGEQGGRRKVGVALVMLVAAAALAGAFYDRTRTHASTPEVEVPIEVPEATRTGSDDGSAEGSAEVAPSPGCAACTDDEMCSGGRCFPDVAERAEAAYRSMLDAWNSGNSKAFFATYDDPIGCYYNRANVPVAGLRSLRGGHFAGDDASRYEIDSLRVLSADPGRVVIEDRGRFIVAEDREKPHLRRIVFVARPNNTWRIAVESSEASHECAADLYE